MNFLRKIACIAVALLLAEAAVGQGPGQVAIRVRPDEQDMREFNGLMKAAKAALVNGNLPDAEEFYTGALAILPYGEARLNLAQIYERENRIKEAEVQYHEILYSMSNKSSVGLDPTTHMRYILLLLKLKKWPEAVAVYHADKGYPIEGLPDFDAKHPDYNRMAALAHALLGGFSALHAQAWPPAAQRRAHIDEALRLEQKSAFVHYCAGEFYRETGNGVAARAAYFCAASLPGKDRSWQDRAKQAASTIRLPQQHVNSKPSQPEPK